MSPHGHGSAPHSCHGGDASDSTRCSSRSEAFRNGRLDLGEIFARIRAVGLPPEGIHLNFVIQKFQEQLILLALQAENWNITGAARRLRLPHSTLKGHMVKLGIKVPPEKVWIRGRPPG